MILKLPTGHARFEKSKVWHRWFAWRPVIISDDDLNFIKITWLRFIMRKKTYWPGYSGSYTDVEYKLIESTKK